MTQFIVSALLLAALLYSPSMSAQECNCHIELDEGQITYSPGCDRPAEVCSIELGPNLYDIDLSQFSDLRDVTVYIGNQASPTFRGYTLASELTEFILPGGGGGVVLTVIDEQGNINAMGPGTGNNPDGIRKYNMELKKCGGTCTLARPTETAFLPVSLLSWTTKAYAQYVELRWATVAEADNAYFRLLHSQDGRSFQEIATISGNGTTDIISEYSFRHLSPTAGSNYYRIEQVDYDGSTNGLGVQSANWRGDQQTVLSATPNPAQVGSKLTVNLAGTEGEVAKIISPAGRLVGEYRIEDGGFVVPSLTTGMYLVRVRDRTTRFLIAQ